MTDTDNRPARARSRSQKREGSGWYRVSNLAAGTARIDIYDEIGFWGVTAQDFLRDLAAVSGPVEIHLNSAGGDPFDGYAIYLALAARAGVTTVVDSLAASAASIIAMAGEQRLMAKYAQLMIHDAWAISDGNADDLRHMADRLDTVSGQIAGLYADTAGGDPSFWREQMRAETWYTPEQALAAGLITGITVTAREPAAVPAAASAGAPGIRAAAQPWDPDGDGDDDSTPEGDTDHSHWAPDGTQLLPVPGKPMPGMPPADSGREAPPGAAAARRDPLAGARDPGGGDDGSQDHAGSGIEGRAADSLIAAGITPAAAQARVDGGQPQPGALAGTSPSTTAAAPAVAAHSSTGPHPHPAGHAAREKRDTTVTTTTMSITDRAARRNEIEARLTAIGGEHGDGELPAEAQQEWDALTAELDEHEGVLARHEEGLTARRGRLAAIAARQQGERAADAGYAAPDGGETAPAAGTGQVPPAFRPGPQNRAPALGRGRADASVYDLDGLRMRSRSPEEMTALCRENALRAVERAIFPGAESREKAQATVERLLARVDDENATLAKRILVTGSPLYMQAWSKAVARLSTATLAPDEIRALSVGTGSDGGFAVPFELDPTVILTSNGAINPLRQISRVQTITGKEYDLVTSAGVTVSRSAEASAVANNNPTLAQPTIKANRVTGFVPFSVEVEQDWAALQSEMMMLLADAKDVEESSSFTNGDGTGTNAGGIIGTIAAGSIVNGTGGSGALAAADLYAVENASAPRFRSRANWLASKTTYNAYRQLFTVTASAAGDPWVRPTQGTPAELLGYPAYEDSDMVATHATNDKVIAFGDFKRGFIIVDRLGMAVEMVPHLFDQATARPTGQRGLLAIWRNNSRILVDNAFRVIKVA